MTIASFSHKSHVDDDDVGVDVDVDVEFDADVDVDRDFDVWLHPQSSVSNFLPHVFFILLE